MKRLLDLSLSVLALALFLPIMAVVASLVAVGLGRPILFFQLRPGQNGRPFKFYKFRTMKDIRDSDGRLLPDDQRLTSLGCFLRATSLDELPQLINVVKGDMSLVGPRPLLMEYLPLYTPEQARRHEVRPGITGWAQIRGRNSLSWEERFRLDVWYVDNRSLWLDIKIIFLTVLRVLQANGINQPGQATMTRFTGVRDE